MAFRDFTFPDVLTKLGLAIQDVEMTHGLEVAAVNGEFGRLLDEGLSVAVGDLGICSEKAKSEFLIARVLPAGVQKM